MRECTAAANLFTVLKENTQSVSQQLVRTLAADDAYTKDTTCTAWQTKVTDKATDVAAYEKLIAAQGKSGSVNGAYGLSRVQGGADSNVTHIAFLGMPRI